MKGCVYVEAVQSVSAKNDSGGMICLTNGCLASSVSKRQPSFNRNPRPFLAF